MCGIVGYIGSKDAYPILIEGLKRLEYRGYDSAGVALINGEFCVSELADILNMSQSAVSHQLKALRNAKLIRSRRDGRMIYYALDDDHIKDILDESMIHVLDC